MKNLLFIIMFCLFSLSACNYPQDGPKSNTSQTSRILDYKNGVYFFDSKGSEYGTSLSNFISENPDVEIIDTESAGRGYWVIVRKK